MDSLIYLKSCSKCKTEKSVDCFYKDKTRIDGFDKRCKQCSAAKNKEYQSKKNPNRKKRLLFFCLETDKKLKKRIYDQQYRIKNKEKIKKHNRAYSLRHRKESINARLAHNIRTRVKKALKKYSVSKSIGCSWGFLKGYLESKFQTGMNWSNYGVKGWHVDHIYPLSKFDLKNKDEFEKACHYSNLQPLWAADNIKKSNSI